MQQMRFVLVFVLVLIHSGVTNAMQARISEIIIKNINTMKNNSLDFDNLCRDDSDCERHGDFMNCVLVNIDYTRKDPDNAWKTIEEIRTSMGLVPKSELSTMTSTASLKATATLSTQSRRILKTWK